VIFAIRVTREARRALGRARVVVPRVAIFALFVFRNAMKPRKLRYVVTRRACGRRRDPVGAVRPVTIRAPSGDLAVYGRGFGGVASGAGHFLIAAVLVVAIRARLVPERRGALLCRVAVFARRDEGAAVRLVTLNALDVSLRRDGDDGRVARRARRFDLGRLVRKPFVTARTRRVARVRRRERDLLRVTPDAQRLIRFLRKIERELVRDVARGARHAAVKRVIRRRDLMTTAARLRDFRGHCFRVRVVTPDARLHRLRMIRMHIFVARDAHWIARGADVVG
jgi:hypothetical protein